MQRCNDATMRRAYIALYKGAGLSNASQAAKTEADGVLVRHIMYPQHYYQIRALSSDYQQGEAEADIDTKDAVNKLWRIFSKTPTPERPRS